MLTATYTAQEAVEDIDRYSKWANILLQFFDMDGDVYAVERGAEEIGDDTFVRKMPSDADAIEWAGKVASEYWQTLPD